MRSLACDWDPEAGVLRENMAAFHSSLLSGFAPCDTDSVLIGQHRFPLTWKLIACIT